MYDEIAEVTGAGILGFDFLIRDIEADFRARNHDFHLPDR
jgi:hypothetical protein